MSELMIKGFLLARLLELGRDKMEAADFAAVEERVGVRYKTLKLQYFKDYPVSLQNEIEQELAKVVWGRDDDRAFYHFGRTNFDTFASSTIGKATLAMTGRDPAKFMRASIKLMSTVLSGMDIKIEDLASNKFSFRFRNNPYRPIGWQGIIDAAMNHIGVEPKVTIVAHGGKDTEYMVEW